MNAKEISDSTLESVTPADNDLMLIYDTSEGTTGKATIADIAPKVAENIDIATLPAVTPAADDFLMIRDTSAGKTGKTTIADIFNNIKKISGEKREINLANKSNIFNDWFSLPSVSVPAGAFILKVELNYENINISDDFGMSLGRRTSSNPLYFILICSFSGVDVTGSMKAGVTVYYI